MTVAALKVVIKELEAKVIKVEEEINTKLTTEIKHLEMMSCDMDDYTDSRGVVTVNRVVGQIRAPKPSFIAENTAPTTYVKFEGLI